jgi:hypothetical protein
VARGWESKSVEAQQEDAARSAGAGAARAMTQAEQDRLTERRTLELARARVLADLRVATLPAHRAVLERSLEALESALRA